MDNESRNTFIVIGVVLVGLLAISLIFSGRSADAVYTGPAVHQQYQVAALPEETDPAPEDVDVAGEQPEDVEPVDADAAEEEAPAEVAEEPPAEEAPAEDVAEAPAEEAPAEDVTEAPAEEAPTEEVAEAPAEEAPAEDAAEAPDEEAPAEQVALAGDPAAGERVWRQCQACHQIGDGAQNRVGPHLTDIIDRPKAAVDGFNYSSALAARGTEGGIWSVDELRGFLAAPREYMPGTSMAFAGVRSEGDLDNLIAYLATYE
jgi:cytochrome c2